MKQNDRVNIALFLTGLIARVMGLAFQGIHDIDQILIDWGSTTLHAGLGKAFYGIYGVLSYLLAGGCVWVAEQIPRFWWAPYKITNIACEIGILFLLTRDLSPGDKRKVYWLYWLNPLFIIAGAWQGFWEGPYVFFGLLAARMLLLKVRMEIRWLLVGVFLMISANFKPQGGFYFALPVTIFLLFAAWRSASSRRNFGCYLTGLFGTFLLLSCLLLLLGGQVTGILEKYLDTLHIMPNLSNNALNIWTPISHALQIYYGQSGEVNDLVLPPLLLNSLHIFASLITLFLIFLACLRFYPVAIENPQDANQEPMTAILTRLIRVVGAGLLCWVIFQAFHPSGPAVVRSILGLNSIKRFLVFAGLASGGVFLLIFAAFSARLLFKACDAIENLFKMRIPAGGRFFPPDAAQGIYQTTLLLLAFTALVISQINTRGHVNHSYGGLVLIIPFLLASRAGFWPWIGMIAVHFYGLFIRYGLGQPVVMPMRDLDNPAAQAFITEIQNSFSTHPYIFLLDLQSGVKKILENLDLAHEWISISFLLVIQFGCVLFLLRDILLQSDWQTIGVQNGGAL